MTKPTNSSASFATSEAYSHFSRKAFALHSLCVLALASALWLAQNVHAYSLVFNPSQTLLLLWAMECPIVILGYSFLRSNPSHCSYWKAVRRGLLGLPAGALVNAFGAFILGAPVGIEYSTKTVNWSLLMSLFTFVPAAVVFGLSWKDWQRLFAHSKLVGGVDYMIAVPAHGAVIGAWFGAWPMPLDWERPWQEWPICVSYGALAGYLLGTVASLVFVYVISRKQHIKSD